MTTTRAIPKPRLQVGTCNVCGGQLPKRLGSVLLYCSGPCRKFAHTDHTAARRTLTTLCRLCNDIIPPDFRGRTIYCSVKCRSKVMEERTAKKRQAETWYTGGDSRDLESMDFVELYQLCKKLEKA